MRLSFFILASLIYVSSNAQLTGLSVQLKSNLEVKSPTSLQQGGQVIARECLPDTLLYGRYKATGYTALTCFDGYSLGQFYESPDTVTYSGFQFYAWQSEGTADTVQITCNLYLAGTDSLPTGSPVRSVTLEVDSTFGGGILTNLMKRVSFSGYTTDQPVIFTVESSDTVRVAVVCNNYAATPGDGEMENLMSGSVAGVWYRGLNLNVGGTTLDADMVFEPFVQYKLYNNFQPIDCYNYADSVILKNTSSPFFESKMYSLYTFYSLGYINHRWNYGHNTGYYNTKDGRIRWVTPDNYDVTLISTLYGFTVRPTCVDTVKHELIYKPNAISFTVDTPVCSGNPVSISALSNANTTWYESPNRVDSFYSGTSYTTPPLNQDVSYYVEGTNRHCTSGIRKIDVRVVETPTDPVIKEDSICLNARADLEASATVGEVRWFDSPSSQQAIDTGDFFQTPVLSKDQSWWVEVFNEKCTNGKRDEVKAHVNANFAPSAPSMPSDTAVCVQTDSLGIVANGGSNQVRWFQFPSDQVPMATGDIFKIAGNVPSATILFADAYDGQCASSKNNIYVEVKTFPEVTDRLLDSTCFGRDFTKQLVLSSGSARWFESPSGGVEIAEGLNYTFSSPTAESRLYIETFAGDCVDTVRRAFDLFVIDLGTVNSVEGETSVCKGETLTLLINTGTGEGLWADNPDFFNAEKSASIVLEDFESSRTLFVGSDHLGCIGEPLDVSLVALDLPTAVYDFQILSPGNVEFVSKQSSAQSFSWDFDDGTNASGRTVNHEFTKNGDFDVQSIVILDNGCSDTFSRTITIGGLTNSIEKLNRFGIYLYPNPARDDIHLVSDQDVVKIELRTSEGRIVREYKDGLAVLSLDGLASGVYYLNVYGQNQWIAKRRIIKVE